MPLTHISLRAVFRLARVGLHLLWGTATVALAFPLLPVSTRRWLKARWSRQLLDALGVRLRVTGTPAADALLVANHISWLDVYVINALIPAIFVSKDDVRRWPLIGWLSACNETLFMERGSRNSAMRTRELLADELRMRNSVCLFPEGTTSLGNSVLPFHGALFQAAIDASTHVAPTALQYRGRNGELSLTAAYTGDTSLWQSLCAIASASNLTAEVCFLSPIDSSGMNRRQLALQSQHLIAGHLERSRPRMTEEFSALVALRNKKCVGHCA